MLSAETSYILFQRALLLRAPVAAGVFRSNFLNMPRVLQLPAKPSQQRPPVFSDSHLRAAYDFSQAATQDPAVPVHHEPDIGAKRARGVLSHEKTSNSAADVLLQCSAAGYDYAAPLAPSRRKSARVVKRQLSAAAVAAASALASLHGHSRARRPATTPGRVALRASYPDLPPSTKSDAQTSSTAGSRRSRRKSTSTASSSSSESSDSAPVALNMQHRARPSLGHVLGDATVASAAVPRSRPSLGMALGDVKTLDVDITAALLPSHVMLQRGRPSVGHDNEGVNASPATAVSFPGISVAADDEFQPVGDAGLGAADFDLDANADNDAPLQLRLPPKAPSHAARVAAGAASAGRAARAPAMPTLRIVRDAFAAASPATHVAGNAASPQATARRTVARPPPPLPPPPGRPLQLRLVPPPPPPRLPLLTLAHGRQAVCVAAGARIPLLRGVETVLQGAAGGGWAQVLGAGGSSGSCDGALIAVTPPSMICESPPSYALGAVQSASAALLQSRATRAEAGPLALSAASLLEQHGPENVLRVSLIPLHRLLDTAAGVSPADVARAAATAHASFFAGAAIAAVASAPSVAAPLFQAFAHAVPQEVALPAALEFIANGSGGFDTSSGARDDDAYNVQRANAHTFRFDLRAMEVSGPWLWYVRDREADLRLKLQLLAARDSLLHDVEAATRGGCGVGGGRPAGAARAGEKRTGASELPQPARATASMRRSVLPPDSRRAPALRSPAAPQALHLPQRREKVASSDGWVG